MKSIQLSYSDLKQFKHLKVKNLVRFNEYLGLAVISLSNGDIVKVNKDGRYISQLDGYSVYEDVLIWDDAEERATGTLGLIKTM